MWNDRTESLRGEKEWPDALRRRAGRIVAAHRFKLSQYPAARILDSALFAGLIIDADASGIARSSGEG
jgi:hypothetical protein